jgi:hypothetical protein
VIPQTSNEVIQGFLEPGRSSERKQFPADIELRTSWKSCPQNRLAVEVKVDRMPTGALVAY